ncbi:MAG: hypothetical protein EZS28_050893 [Streblomastix strix]|uniref:Uncharacterized protein n=1 Tax=Streblomastix strix TaxID=222440 RepID=A0A5J4T7Y8_9EUKA|nr:MAG: hypothetical protein EZS28_050893 [Streblomastix strix]
MERRSERILLALSERALENKQNLSNLYLFPHRGIEKLTGIKQKKHERKNDENKVRRLPEFQDKSVQKACKMGRQSLRASREEPLAGQNNPVKNEKNDMKMEYSIRVREQKTIEANSFEDYNRQIDALKSTLCPREKLIEVTRIIGMAVILKVESPEIDARRVALNLLTPYGKNGIAYFLTEFSKISEELAPVNSFSDAKE